MSAKWQSLSTLCRERDWSKRRLLYELQNGMPYRTIPPGHTINWHDPALQITLNVEASETLIVSAEKRPLVVGIEVLPPKNTAQIPPPANAKAVKPPSQTKLKAAVLATAKEFKPDNPPTAPEWKAALEMKLGREVTRKCARDALGDLAPQLLRKRGHKRNRRS